MKIIETLKSRFEKNLKRHPSIDWKNVEAKLLVQSSKLKSLQMMEDTGGEPDVVSVNKNLNEFIFMDCSIESPTGRRSLCYDKAALDARKENKPKDSAMSVAVVMGIEILNEEQYRFLQTLGNFDLKTSSWIQTPESIRKLKGALFCDRRYDTVFTYHNGAESYYAARGFRGFVKI
jgi:hypothetical protein